MDTLRSEVAKPIRWASAARWLLIVLAIPVFAMVWLMTTTAGARFALGFAGPLLSYQDLAGDLAGPLRLSGVRIHIENHEISAASLTVDPALLPLMLGRIELEQFGVSGLRVALAATQASADDPAPTPSSVESIELPQLTIRELQIEGAELAGMLAEPILLESLRARITTGGTSVRVEELTWSMPQLHGRLRTEVDLAGWLGTLDLTLTPRLGPAEAEPLSLSIDAQGETVEAKLRLFGNAGDVRMELNDRAGTSTFKARLDSPGLELAPYGFPGLPAIPPLALNISGDASQARVDGAVNVFGERLQLDGTHVQWDAAQLRLTPMQVKLADGGEISAEGGIGLTQQDANLRLSWKNLPLGRLSNGVLPELSSPSGDWTLGGNVLDWQLNGPFSLDYRGIPMSLELTASGDSEAVEIERLRADVGTDDERLSSLTVAAKLQTSAPYAMSSDVVVHQLEPEVFDAAWPGNVSFRVNAAGALEESMALTIDSVEGQLRGQPLAGHIKAKLRGRRIDDVDAELRWGGNALTAGMRKSEPLQARWDLSGLTLVDPELSGAVRGQLTWQRETGRLATEFNGTSIRYRADAVGRIAGTADLTLNSELEAPMAMTIEIEQAQSSGQSVDQLTLQLAGSTASHTLDLAMAAAAVDVELSLSGSYRQPDWRGQLERLRLAPGGAAPSEFQGQRWLLKAPAAVQWVAQHWGAQGLCLVPEAGAHPAAGSEVCLNGVRQDAGQRVDVTLKDLPLMLINPWLAAYNVSVQGSAAGGGSLQFGDDGTLQGKVEIAADGTRLRLDTDDRPLEWHFKQLRVVAAPDPEQGLAAMLSSDIEGLGQLTLEQSAAGARKLVVDFPELTALNGIAPDIVGIKGTLRGDLSLDQNVPVGTLAVEGLALELPAAGLKLRDIAVAARAQGDQLALDGSLASGDGVLRLSGSVNPSAWRKTLDLQLSGDQFLALDLPQARAVVSPQVRVRAGESAIRVDGTMVIPEAVIDLQQFEPAVQASSDVVLVDAPEPTQESFPLRSDLRFTLGENVQLRGFGLDGRLTGGLRLRERPDRPATARGEIAVTGTYKAYGQDLKIERGRLLFANSALDNPGLDIRAVRVVGRVKAGVQVRGPAELPELSTYSEPAMDQLNTISYLVLGRPAAEARGAGGADVQNAAQQLGGNLLAKSVGQRLGLEVGIESSAELGGGSAFTVGKYLSPRLFVGYGKALYDSAQLFIVRYRLTDRYELEALSGREQKGGINYRLER